MPQIEDKKVKIGIMIGIVAILVFIFLIVSAIKGGDHSAVSNTDKAVTETTEGSRPGTEESSAHGTEEAQQSQTDAAEASKTDSESGKSTESATPTLKPGDSGESSQDKDGSHSSESAGNADGIIERVDASYEEWLAGAMVIGISLEHMDLLQNEDFDITGIYLTGTNELDDHMESDGAYVEFISGGKTYIIHSAPLESERKDQAGSVDLYSDELGYSTFDLVTEAFGTKISAEDLSDVISQSILISICKH